MSGVLSSGKGLKGATTRPLTSRYGGWSFGRRSLTGRSQTGQCPAIWPFSARSTGPRIRCSGLAYSRTGGGPIGPGRAYYLWAALGTPSATRAPRPAWTARLRYNGPRPHCMPRPATRRGSLKNCAKTCCRVG